MVAVVAGLALAGCTDVPESSSPTVIQSQVLQPPSSAPNKPSPGLTPTSVVTAFLDLNGAADPNHADARQYLTARANTRWADDRITVVDFTRVQAAQGSGSTRTVKVIGSTLGTIDAAGGYTPVLVGNGLTGRPYPGGTFTLRKVEGEWRIDQPQVGLLVTASQFAQFQQRSLYFFDSAEQELVPDPRFTQLTDPSALATWLLRGLAAGPRDALAGGAQVTELPNQPDLSRLTVIVPPDDSDAVQLAIPGAATSQRDLLAAQLAKTMEDVPGIGSERGLEIFDGDEPVTIKGVGRVFSAAYFPKAGSPGLDFPELYYVDNGGGVVSARGVEIAGKIGTGYYDLTSVALKRASAATGLLVAGVRPAKGAQLVDVGTEYGRFTPVDGVTGELSRPDWAPHQAEFWIGSGSKVYRVTVDGAVSVVPLLTPSGRSEGRVAALRFSPDGARVAVVLVTTDQDGREISQVSVGAVVRGSGGVRVEGLVPITAVGVAVTDVSWNDELKIFGIGHDVTTEVAQIYEFQSDGSRWSPRGTANLPNEPQTITVASGQDAAVAVGNSVWKQRSGTWEPVRPGIDSPGSAPIYVR